MTSRAVLSLREPILYSYSGEVAITNYSIGPITLKKEIEATRVKRILNNKTVEAVFYLVSNGETSPLETLILKKADERNSEAMFPSFQLHFTKRFTLTIPQDSNLILEILVDSALAATSLIMPFGENCGAERKYPLSKFNILPSLTSPATSPVSDRPLFSPPLEIVFSTVSAPFSLKRVSEETDV